MAELNMGAQPAINFDALNAELRAALPGKLDGLNFAHKTGELTVIVSAGQDAEALRPQVAAVIAAHDPSVKTPEQAKVAAQEAALTDLKAVDFTALQKSGTLQEVRDAVFKLALAFGLAEPPDGKG